LSDLYLYIIKCHDGSLYTGISTNVGRRFSEHQGKGDAGSKYLKGKGPLSLVFEKKVGSKSLALKVESKIKKLPKAKKESLMEVPGYIEGIVKQASGN
jgi:putative endonuclease